MFPERRIFLLLAACAAGTFAAQPGSDAEVERYERLMDDIRDFERYDNAEMNDLIFAGLHSGNPRVVELTIAAMNRESRSRELRRDVDVLDGKFRDQLGKRERDLAHVPGLKNFLIDYAAEGLAKHGWKALGKFDFYERNLWNLAFPLLVDYFPGDPDVRRLLHASLADDPDAADMPHYLMNLLNTGLYMDEAADEVRLAVLADPTTDWAGSAARGLAMTGSEAGLEAMGRNLWRRGHPLRDIVAAMGSYGARAAPHMAALRELGPEERKSLTMSDPPALRVAEQVARLSDPPAPSHHSPAAPQTPGAPSASAADAGVEVDPGNVPVVTNWRGEQMPLDHALQVYDEFSEPRILDATFAGLHSADPAVVEQTVIAIGFYANIVTQRNRPHFAPPERAEELIDIMDPRTRRLDKVPGLRGFLLSYARRGLNPAACGDLGAQRIAERPPWMFAAGTLAVYFPGNPEVRDLVLDMGQCLDDANVAQSILPLLAIGRFRGEAVERWRIAKLSQANPVKAGWAARGLGWSQTEEGLEALAKHLSRRDEALAEIVDAIACYGGRAAPHLPALRALSTQATNLPEAARARIASATDKVAKLAALRQEKLAEAPL